MSANCFSFWETLSPDTLPGLRHWGTSVRQTSWAIGSQMKIHGAAAAAAASHWGHQPTLWAVVQWYSFCVNTCGVL